MKVLIKLPPSGSEFETIGCAALVGLMGVGNK
jgi:hypothetical protein